jgi:segregation and condensation protein A
MHYNVKIEAFEGPLDLLLHLINRLEIDIYDIPVSEITEQYLLYIHTMKELELDIASEFLVMAATLLAIKSKMLLPKYEENIEDDINLEEEEDPRDELVERLVEYKKYKEAAHEFKNLEEDRGLIFTKPPSDLSDYSKESNADKVELDVTIYDMLAAFQKLMRRKRLQKPLSTKVTRQEIPIEKRITEIIGLLRRHGGRKSFYDLFPIPDRNHIVVTFLAVLELMKRQEIHVEQEQNFAEIFVAAKEGGDKLGNN